MEIISYLAWCLYVAFNRDAYVTREHKFVGWCTMIAILTIYGTINRFLRANGWIEGKKEVFSGVLTLLIVVVICILFVIFEPYIAPYIII